MKNLRTTCFTLLIITISVSGCSLKDVVNLWIPNDQGHTAYTNNGIQNSEMRASFGSRDQDFIEVLWKPAQHRVDSYLISYGFAPNALAHSQQLRPYEIETNYDPMQGKQYKYTLNNIPSATSVFLKVFAVVDGHHYPLTKIIETNPSF